MDLSTASEIAEARRTAIRDLRSKETEPNPEKTPRERWLDIGERIVALSEKPKQLETRTWIDFPEQRLRLDLRAQHTVYVDGSSEPTLFGVEAIWRDTTLDTPTHTGMEYAAIDQEYMSSGEVPGADGDLALLELLEASVQAAEEQRALQSQVA